MYLIDGHKSHDKKNQKTREKLGLDRPLPPTPLSKFFIFFFENMYNNKKQDKKYKLSKKNPKSELGLDPPTHFRVFLGFSDFFNLTKPLNQWCPIGS